MQVMRGTLFFAAGLLLAYIFPIQIGGLIGDIFGGIVGTTTTLYLAYEVIRWLTIFVLVILAPMMFMSNKSTSADLMKKLAGGD